MLKLERNDAVNVSEICLKPGTVQLYISKLYNELTLMKLTRLPASNDCNGKRDLHYTYLSFSILFIHTDRCTAYCAGNVWLIRGPHAYAAQAIHVATIKLDRVSYGI